MSSSGEIFKLTKDDNIGIVSFDVAGEVMNTWTKEAFASFSKVLDTVEKDKEIKGVVFISGKPNTFFAGANLKIVEQLQTEEQKRNLINLFQHHFNRLSALEVPTLAAINGHCLGGGLEFALSCSARIAKDSKTTVLGLPEANVGIIPAAGGTQRLPRLIGYPAIDLIMKGTMLSAGAAFDLGIVDRLVHASGDLLKEALSSMKDIISGTAELKRPEYDWSKIDEVVEKLRHELIKAKGRELPAPLMVLKSIQGGVRLPLEDGLKHEIECGVQILMTKEATGSINTFFIRTMIEKPKAMMTKGFVPKPLKTFAVVGFGEIGRGIVVDILRNMQIPVVVKDIKEALGPGRLFIKKTLDGLSERKKLKMPVNDLMNLVTFTETYRDSFKDVDIIIESIFEDIELKKQVYQELSTIVRDDCIIASTTSSISINKLSQHVKSPERFSGIHLFSPVWMTELMEVVKGEKTSPETIDNILNFSDLLRKKSIICKDNKGFIVNALLIPYICLAFEYLEEGNTIEKIEAAMTKFGMSKGPFRHIEEMGIDSTAKLFDNMKIQEKSLENIVQAGHLSFKKCGKGIFLDGKVDSRILNLIEKKEPKAKTEEEIQRGLITAMAKAGSDLIDRDVVTDPRLIDAGLLWGAGFPSEKGGPMKWADLIGISKKLFGKDFY
jgi:3-hydroxyacyl-CoA dehydrogenase/enoyl-CoA hydratase/carnithine racemase